MPTVASLPVATEVSSTDELIISQVGSGGTVLRSVTVELLLSGESGVAVESVVGETGNVTSTQIATALAGSGLAVVNGQLEVNFTAPVTSVVGAEGAITSTQIATALAGTGLSVSNGQLEVTGGGGGGSTAVPVITVGAAGSTYALSFASGTGDIAYDITLTGAITFTLTPACTSGYLHKINLIIRQPSGAGYAVTLPPQGTATGDVRWTGGVVPTVGTSAGQITFIQLLTTDGGATVLGQ